MVKPGLHNTSHLVTFLSRCRLLATANGPAIKAIKKQKSHKPQQLNYAAHYPTTHHIWATEWQRPSENAASAFPLAWQFFISHILVRWKLQHKEGGREKGTLKNGRNWNNTHKLEGRELQMTADNLKLWRRMSIPYWSPSYLALAIRVKSLSCSCLSPCKDVSLVPNPHT